MALLAEQAASPRLNEEELNRVRASAQRVSYEDGEPVFKVGDPNVDFFVVESGALRIVNPVDQNRIVATLGPAEFSGDIDLLTRRPVIVSAFARGRTILLKVSGKELRRLLRLVPRLGEKLMHAFTIRRELLKQAGVLGLRVAGSGEDADAVLLQEFLFRNFVPFTAYDIDDKDGRDLLARYGATAEDTPLVICGDEQVLRRPGLMHVAECAGLRQDCPDRVYDLAVIGAGPAGLTTAVYAASEGLATIVLDKLGPGGQASGSSMIENFIGFPGGLSGAEFATRGTLQMLKFGAQLYTPVEVSRIDPGEEFHTLKSRECGDFRARVVLLASGADWRRLPARNARRFERAGIYYAATAIEADLCAGKPVAVIGGGNSGGQAAMYLSECSPRVYLLVLGDDHAEGMSRYLAQRISECERIQVLTNSEVQAVLGESELEGLEVLDHRTNSKSCLPCSAAFVFIGGQPRTSWLPDSIARDADGHILTGSAAQRSGRWPLKREPHVLETSLPRVLAAGDVRAGSTKRVAFAVGDGAMAVTCVHRLRQIED